MRWNVAARITEVNKYVMWCEVKCVCSFERLFKQGKVNKKLLKCTFFFDLYL